MKNWVVITLIILLGFLLLCLGYLVNWNEYYGPYLREDQAALFIGISILAGASLLALCQKSRSNDHRLHQDYLTFLRALEDAPLSRKELAEQIGETQVWKPFEAKQEEESSSGQTPSNGHMEKALSDQQLRNLNELIYEGKLREREGNISLPASGP